MTTSSKMADESSLPDSDYLRDIESTLNEWHDKHDEAAYCALANAVATPDHRRINMSHAELVYQHLKQLPESLAAEVLDFVQFLEHKQARAGTYEPREPGSAKGLIWIADDIDAPLADFKDYQ